MHQNPRGLDLHLNTIWYDEFAQNDHSRFHLQCRCLWIHDNAFTTRNFHGLGKDGFRAKLGSPWRQTGILVKIFVARKLGEVSIGVLDHGGGKEVADRLRQGTDSSLAGWNEKKAE